MCQGQLVFVETTSARAAERFLKEIFRVEGEVYCDQRGDAHLLFHRRLAAQ
jgi:hypothetical protein